MFKRVQELMNQNKKQDKPEQKSSKLSSNSIYPPTQINQIKKVKEVKEDLQITQTNFPPIF